METPVLRKVKQQKMSYCSAIWASASSPVVLVVNRIGLRMLSWKRVSGCPYPRDGDHKRQGAVFDRTTRRCFFHVNPRSDRGGRGAGLGTANGSWV